MHATGNRNLTEQTVDRFSMLPKTISTTNQAFYAKVTFSPY
jgi:hypothetical protein